MSKSKTINGNSVTLVQSGDSNWAGYTTQMLETIIDNMVDKGQSVLDNNSSISWDNAASTLTLSLKVNASDNLEFNSNKVLDAGDIVNDDTTGGTDVPASAEIVKTHGTEIDDKLNISDIDDTPADDADVPVSSKWVYDNIYKAWKAKTSSGKTIDYTITDNDGIETIYLNDTDNTRTITLPTASDNTDREITIYNNNSYSYNGSNDNNRSVNIQTEGSETINGVDTTATGNPINIEHQYCGLTFKSDGSNWLIIRTIGECDINTTCNSGSIELEYQKTFTGTSDADSSTSITHGIDDHDKIIQCTGHIRRDSTNQYRVYDCERYDASSNGRGWNLAFDENVVYLANVGGELQSETYWVRIKYYI